MQGNGRLSAVAFLKYNYMRRINMTPQEEFIEIYNKYITRQGADELLEWLKRTDFLPPCKFKISLCL